MKPLNEHCARSDRDCNRCPGFVWDRRQQRALTCGCRHHHHVQVLSRTDPKEG